MPPAVVAVGSAAVAASAAYTSGIVIFGATLIEAGIVAAVVAGVGVLAMGFAAQALTPKPDAPSLPDLGSFQRDNLLTVRQAAAARSIVFGRARAGGYITFIHTTGSDNSKLHLIVTVAGHPVRGFSALLFDDEVIPLDGSGNATGTYAGLVKCVYGLGTTAGDAAFNAALVAAVPDKWTSDHRQSGCAKAYIALTYDSDKFPSGIPNITFIVDGYDRVVDPRVAGSPTAVGWTDNAALCIAQYFRDTGRGLGYPADFIDEDTVVAAANACDEMVNRKAAGVTFTVDAASDVVTLADTSASLRNGTRFQVRGAGSPDPDGLPGGLAAYTNYYWVEITTTTGRIATSLANARAGIHVDITSAGSGTLTLVVNAEPRYTLNGVIETDEDPESIIPRLLSAMAGRKSEPAGKLSLYAGVWSEPTIAFDEDDLDGPLSSQHRRSFRDLFNGVKGVFVSPDDLYQPTDFPPVSDTDYILEDGERIWRDAELRFTNSPSMAQRIARIDLERNRRQIAVSIPLNLRGVKIKAGENFSFTNEKRGWNAKAFYCAQWGLAVLNDERGIRLGVRASGEETDANVFAWDETVDEQTLTPAPTTNLPSARNIPAPTNLQLFSGTAVLDLNEDGTVNSRILATWAAPSSVFVTSGGTIEVEFRKASGSPAEAWRPYGVIRGDQTQVYIRDVEDGIAYDVRIRARSVAGTASEWLEALNHTVIGKTAAPSDVTGFAAQQNGNVVTFQWAQIADVDLAGYEIRYAAPGTFQWEGAQSLTSVTRGTRITTAAVPPGDWRFGIKARDTSGNYSESEATYDLEVVSSNEVIEEIEQAPYWRGTKTNFLRHWSGVLVPESTKLPFEHTNAELFEQFVPYPQDECEYEAPVIDMGFDAMNVRVYAEHEAPLGRGVVASTADPELSIDYRSQAGVFDGYEDWTIGTANFRYLKARLCIDAPDRRAYLSSFKPVVDAEERTIAFTFEGGVAVAFSPQFNRTPAIQVTPESAAGSPTQARYATYEGPSETGFTPRVWDAAGNEIAGAAGSGTATGV
jgi:hypothetical protein